MSQLKNREIKEVCLNNLKKYFAGEISKEELDRRTREIETRIAPDPVLFGPETGMEEEHAERISQGV